MAQNITEIIRAIAEENMPGIAVGYVKSVDPLEIILIDDMNISLSDQSVIIPSEKKPAAGEQWYLLSVFRNKIYYFLDRV